MELRKCIDFDTKTLHRVIQYRMIVKLTEQKEIMLKPNSFSSFDKVLIFIVIDTNDNSNIIQ
jgi:hypothetical protein